MASLILLLFDLDNLISAEGATFHQVGLYTRFSYNSFFTGVGLVGIHRLLGAGQQLFQGLRVVFVARGVVNGLDEAVLIDVDRRLIPVSAGLLAVVAGFFAAARP